MICPGPCRLRPAQNDRKGVRDLGCQGVHRQLHNTGSVLSWAAPDEVSRLQWYMLECALPGESAIRTRWHVAVRSALSKRIKRRDVVDGKMACWAMTDGRIDTAAGDQSRGWCAPPIMAEEAGSVW